MSHSFQLIQYLGNEKSRIPWEVAAKQIKSLLDVVNSLCFKLK